MAQNSLVKGPVLVTGGAGYIGSHTARQLIDRGEKVIVLDNLYSGFRWAVPEGAEFVEGDMADQELTARVIRERGVESVIHFAAHLVVEESALKPGKYYRNNVLGTLNFAEVCHREGVKHFIFSSTCAAYGTPEQTPVKETAPTAPVSPYGRSKLTTEHVLWELEEAEKLAGRSNPMRHVILRYFNVAGARVGGGLGQATVGATQLIKVAAEVVVGKRPGMKVFGTDYPTPDGTCIRDYIHVDDLAMAHISSLEYLRRGGQSEMLNCGYGKGYSVREVIASMKRVSGVDFKVEEAPRRAGDSVAIFADTTKLKATLDFEPQFADLDLICRTSLDWERALLKR
jgi:UDP-glucose 4-epimerase